MKRYNPSEIEPKWQKIWQDKNAFHADDTSELPKKYVAGQFPYPSGAGLHAGHAKVYTITDAVARFYRQTGHNVLNPIGWDTFGMPAENYAIKTGISPQSATKTNIANFKQQFQRMGISIDWDREVNTSHPEYYKWTQWIFAQLYKKGLAYQAENDQWWCPSDKTVLANEQVEGGRCWRCGSEVQKKKMKQWFFKITAYAEELLAGLEDLDWPEGVKTAQKNWIGKSIGAEISFAIDHNTSKSIKVFTTRPDTIFGATFMVLAPEHPLIPSLCTDDTKAKVDKYITKAIKKSDIERQETKEKTGVFTGAHAINPATGEKIPIWVADYVLMGYGEGAIMAVPAHDERDYEFAVKYNLPIRQVIAPTITDQDNPPEADKENTTRNVVMCLIKHPTEDKYLTLKWPKLHWHAFVMGGIEQGEDIMAAARREIAEETGYQHLKHLRTMPLTINSVFYARHKDVNRDILTTVLEFQLEDLDRETPKREAHEDFHVVWTPTSNLPGLKPVGELPYILDWIADKPLVYTDEGKMINSGVFDGRSSSEIREEITQWLSDQGIGSAKTTYKMRDWLISRQRYWGAPIPIAFDKKGHPHLIPEDQLPVVLPDIDDYQPDGSGRSPLAKDKDWLKVTINGEEMTRETDTMDGFACSSWYLLRYCDPRNTKTAWDKDKINYWNPVDYYVGGEHSTTHMLYVRFWTLVFRDLGLTNFAEPIHKFMKNGQILAEDGRKMSKSLGNTIDPLQVIDDGYGADTLRTYILFMVPPEGDAAWSTTGLGGVYRFLNRCWTLSQSITNTAQPANLAIRHKTIKKVTEDIYRDSFNTAIAALMEYVNNLYKFTPEKEDIIILAKLLGPFAPNLSSEILEQLGADDTWPDWDEKYLQEDTVEVVVQINGKLRAKLSLPTDQITDDKIMESAALNDEKIKSILSGQTPKKIIIPPTRKLINIVI